MCMHQRTAHSMSFHPPPLLPRKHTNLIGALAKQEGGLGESRLTALICRGRGHLGGRNDRIWRPSKTNKHTSSRICAQNRRELPLLGGPHLEDIETEPLAPPPLAPGSKNTTSSCNGIAGLAPRYASAGNVPGWLVGGQVGTLW